MVAIKYIQQTPTNKIGDVTEMAEKGAKLHVEEGIAEYYYKAPKQLRKNSYRFTKLLLCV